MNQNCEVLAWPRHIIAEKGAAGKIVTHPNYAKIIKYTRISIEDELCLEEPEEPLPEIKKIDK